MADNIVLAKYKADVKDALNSLGKLDKKVDKLDKDTKKSSANMLKSFTSAFTKIGAAAGIAFGTQQLVQFGKEAVQVAAKAEGIERAFRRIGNAGLLKDLRNATRGTVSDLELMKTAVQASNFKLPLDQLAGLLKFAAARARETGEEVDYLVNSIVLGIGRKSPLILDNLGISAVELRKRLKGVGVEATSVADIAKIVGDIATEELGKMGDQADTTADQIAQIETAFENMGVEAGKAINDVIKQLIKLGEKQGLIESSTPLRNQIRLTNEYALAVSKAADQIEDDRAREIRIADQVNDKEEFTQKKREERLQLLKTLEKDLATVTSTETRKAENLKLWFAEQALESAVGLDVFQRGAAKERIKEAREDIKDNTIKEGILQAQIKALRTILGLETDGGGEVTESYIRSINQLNEELKSLDTSFKDIAIGSDAWYNKLDEIRIKTQELEDATTLMKATLEGVGVNDPIDFDEEDIKGAAEGIEDLTTLYLKLYPEEVERQTDIADELWEAHFQKLMQEQDAAFENEKRIAAARENLAYATVNSINSIVGSISQIQSNLIQEELQQLDLLLEQGQLSREEYDQRRRELLREQAESQKAAAIFQATVDGAVAVISAFKDGGPILAALVGAAVAAQVAAIASQPLPQFAEGGWVDADGKLVGRSHAQGGIKLEAEGGEYIINKIQSKKHSELIEAVNSGKVEDYIAQKYIIPTVQQIDGSMSGIGASAALNGFNDLNLLRAIDRHRMSDKKNAEYLATEISRHLKPRKRGGFA